MNSKDYREYFLEKLGSDYQSLSDDAKTSLDYYCSRRELKNIELYKHSLEQNKGGQDYIVGDLHGRFEELMNQLKEVKFDKTKDRLIAVGDLGDRGGESEKVIQLLEEPWFYSVRGNHDQFILDQYEPERIQLYNRYSKYDPAELHKKIEGRWFFKLDEQTRAYLAKLLMALPYVIELEVDGYRIGISHAGLPSRYGSSWNGFVNDLEERDTRELCLRTRRHGEMPEQGIERVIEDIDYTVHGHTCFEKPHIGLFSAFIDTFDKSGRLTFLEVSDLVKRLDGNKEFKEALILKEQGSNAHAEEVVENPSKKGKSAIKKGVNAFAKIV